MNTHPGPRSWSLNILLQEKNRDSLRQMTEPGVQCQERTRWAWNISIDQKVRKRSENNGGQGGVLPWWPVNKTWLLVVTGAVLGLGGFHMLWSNWASALGPGELQLLNLCAAVTDGHVPESLCCAPGEATVRSSQTATKSSPCWLH